MKHPLGASHTEVRALRQLLRSHRARDEAGAFVVEGPRLIEAALDHGIELERVYASESDAGHAVVRRCAANGVDVQTLAPGIAEKLGDTVTPQGLFARAPLARRGVDALDGATFVLVADRVSDPGNAGTLIRSAAAAGVEAINLGAGSVDAYNPKVVRATAGALFALPIVEGRPTGEILERIGAAGLRRVGLATRGGTPLDAVDLTGPLALVVGHEVEGLGAAPVDELVTIPMAGRTESLNLAMAATVVCFDARRRRLAAGSPA